MFFRRIAGAPFSPVKKAENAIPKGLKWGLEA